MMGEFYEEDAPKSSDKRRELELLNLRNIIKHEPGRSFMWRLLDKTGIFTSTSDPDPIVGANLAAARDIGLWLEEELKQASFDLYLKMIKENSDGYRR